MLKAVPNSALHCNQCKESVEFCVGHEVLLVHLRCRSHSHLCKMHFGSSAIPYDFEPIRYGKTIF